MLDSYSAIITGAPDGLDDFEFSLKSYHGLHYSELTSNMSFQLIRKLDTITEVIARVNGEILLLKNSVELFRGDIKAFNFFKGPQGATVSVSAQYNIPETTPENIELSVSQIKNEANGARIFTIPYYALFKPLDSLVLGSELVEINKLTLHLQPENNYMLLRENI